jgi:hypothetical protein
MTQHPDQTRHRRRSRTVVAAVAGLPALLQHRVADDVSESTWQRFLDPAEPTQLAIAWQGDKAVGMVQFIYHRTNWSIGNSCYLQDLFVSPEIAAPGRSPADRTRLRHRPRQGLRQSPLADPGNQRHGDSNFTNALPSALALSSFAKPCHK